jgi:hypothetical protein
MRDEVAEVRQMICDWQEYCASGADVSEGFPEWAEKKGRKYGFPAIVFYESDDSDNE